MSLLKKITLLFILILLSITIAACTATETVWQIAASDGEHNTSGTIADDEPLPPLTNDEAMLVPSDEPSQSISKDEIEDFESYIKYITGVPNFKPYYQFVFELGNLSNGVSSVPIEDVIAMYNELKTEYKDINIVSQRPLQYIGNYDGDSNFVHGYDWYQSTGKELGQLDPINYVGKDKAGKEIITTPIKTVILCENTYSLFDSSIVEGRNLQESDFILTAQDQPISVVLGASYRDIYELGDVFSMMYISVMMNFEVVGFYESDLGFSMAAGALQDINVDENIVMPYFIPTYEPVSEEAVYQHGFHIAELTSGYFPITGSINEINDDTHTRYVTIVDKVASRHNLSGMHMSPLWPVGFVFYN